MYFPEREGAVFFPDYCFFAERRLVNYIIEEKRVKNLDDCEPIGTLSIDNTMHDDEFHNPGRIGSSI